VGFDDKALRARGAHPQRASVHERGMLEVALEAAQLAVWELDLGQQILNGSPALYRILGEEPPATPWSVRMLEEHIFADDLPVFRDALARALARSELRCEVRVRRLDGRLVWIAMLGRAMLGAQGDAHRITGVLRDVSERKGSEQFVRERDAQFSAMFDVSNVGMAHADPWSGNLLRINARLAAMLGHTAGELVGRRLMPLVHAQDRERMESALQQLARGTIHAFEGETRLLHRRGGTVWVLMTANVIRDDDGQPTRTVAVVVDITERKRAERSLLEREEELRAARDELERRVAERTAELAHINDALQSEIAERRAAEERVRELLGQQVQAVEAERGRISRELHDTLGQHLAALALSLKSIGERAGDAGGIGERTARAQESLRLMEDELDRLSYELRPLALDDLGLAEALRTHAEHWSKETGVAVDVHTHGLRTGRLPAVVETNVYRIVQEALTNVRKHARATRVGLIAERRPDQLRVVLEDDGAGFDVGSVAPEAGRRLGLRGMSERARLVGAELEIESVPGRGTTIYLAVPLGSVADEVTSR